jgi:glutamate/tyrosine decarboxylase-like PLP-dependent enzyme
MQTSLKDPTWTPTLSLPKHGKDHHSIIQKLTKYSSQENSKWKNGYVSGTVYVADEGHSRLLSDVYQLYSLTNPLHPDVWPSVNQLEAEVCAMTASLLNGGNTNVCGCVSSGGTESIFLAVKAHWQFFGRRRGIRHPEVVSCQTAHAGLDKACEVLGIRNVRTPIDPNTFKIDHKLIERYITMNTIMIYASAPCYPQGVIDPISELSSIAVKHKVGLHVDCCLGGFVLPFAKQLGYLNIPDYDFILPGVTSMSCDTHKYGYSSKGSSVVLYCSQVNDGITWYLSLVALKSNFPYLPLNSLLSVIRT